MARELAIVLSNGSIQSAVVTALAAQKYRPVMIYCETSPSAGRVGQAFDALVQHFKPYRSHRVPTPWLAGLNKSDARSADADPRSSEATTSKLIDLLPLIAAGLRYAVHYNATTLFAGIRIGSEGQDLARVTEYTQIWTELIQMTCDRPALELQTPLLELEPWQVVDLALQVGAPLQLTWSCENLVGEPCNQCRGCRTRETAFQRAARPDPAKDSGKGQAKVAV